MKRKWTLTIALFQAMGLLAADYTAEDVANILDNIDIRKPSFPAGLSYNSAQTDHVMTCRKCGKKMMLKTDPELMKALAAQIISKARFLFTLDDSHLCPHCGNGKYYMVFTKQDRNHDLPFSLTWQAHAMGISSQARSIPLSVPISEEDLLLLCEEFFPNENTRRNFPLMSSFLSPQTSTFTVMKDEDYQAFNNRFSRPPIINLLNKYNFASNRKHGRQIHLIPQHPLSPYVSTVIRQHQIADNAATFQKLTENASVLRKKDLQSFLQQINDLYKTERGFQHRYLALSRMLIIHAPHVPLTCPQCHHQFHVANESRHPFMQPLGDVLCLTANMDLSPDYSSICPYCFPESMSPRLLDVQFTIDSKTYHSSVSPLDLNMLYLYCCRNTNKDHNMVIENDLFDRRSNQQKPTLTAGRLLRLRSILQGMPDTTKISALPLADD
jgi:hypothetical protein